MLLYSKFHFNQYILKVIFNKFIKRIFCSLTARNYPYFCDCFGKTEGARILRQFSKLNINQLADFFYKHKMHLKRFYSKRMWNTWRYPTMSFSYTHFQIVKCSRYLNLLLRAVCNFFTLANISLHTCTYFVYSIF